MSLKLKIKSFGWNIIDSIEALIQVRLELVQLEEFGIEKNVFYSVCTLMVVIVLKDWPRGFAAGEGQEKEKIVK